MEQSGWNSSLEPACISKPAATVESSGDRLCFRVEMVPGETTVVSWKKLLKEANSSNASEAGTSASGPPMEAQPRLAAMASEASDSQRQVGSSRLNNVIERIERIYAGCGSSDEDAMLDDVPDEDEYDTDDSFIDDTELDDYFKADSMETKHDGFFINRGKLEHIEPTISHNQQPRKRRQKDLAECDGGNDGSKHMKLAIKGTTSSQDPAEQCGSRQDKNIDLQDKPFILRPKGSGFDPQIVLLDEVFTELKKLVGEFQPPAKEVHDPASASRVVKRRLPHEIKLMLTKMARLTEDIYGHMPKHVVLRLMDIVGHLMKLRTLKRHLKVMAESGLSARPETDECVRNIKQEVEDMVKLWIPFMKYKVEKVIMLSNDFRESSPAEKESLIRKHCMDDALEDKICDLYELFVARKQENSGWQVEVLYEELAALWPCGFMDTYRIRYAILRAKERRSLSSNLLKDQAIIKKKKAVDCSRAAAMKVTPTLFRNLEKHGEKMVHAAAPTHIACTNKQKQERAKGSSTSSGRPSTEVVEAQFGLGNLQVSQAKGKQKHRESLDLNVPKSYLRLAPPSE